MENKKEAIVFGLLALVGIGGLIWSAWGFIDLGKPTVIENNQQNFNRFKSAELPDKCQTPPDYTDEEWQSHMSHHRDQYSECFATDEITGQAAYRDITAKQLAKVLTDEEIVLIDVHTPQQAHIATTDSYIPCDQIDTNLDKLPEDRKSKIVLYCRSGNMSEIAAARLAELGYTDVYNLIGGINAWKQAGYQLSADPL